MGRTKQAGDSNVGMGTAVEEPGKAPRKPRKPSNMRVVRVAGDGTDVVTLTILEAVSTAKQGGAVINTQTEPGKYAVITIRDVREIGREETTFNRKTGL